MKGKGKSVKEEKEYCPLQFPSLESVDIETECPRLSQILQRGEIDSVNYEELDSLQTDLETLLASLAKRIRGLETEVEVLTNWSDVKKEKRPIGKVDCTPPATPKRGKSVEGKTGKKMREGFKGTTPTSTSRGKGKNASIQSVKLMEVDPIPQIQPPTGQTEQPLIDPVQIAKNEIPNRFWQMVDPYCQDITNDDIKFLEEIIKNHDDNSSEYYKIPLLGKHYAQKWAQEDLLEEQSEGARISRSGGNKPTSNSFIKRIETGESIEESSPFGPLTQRLVSALIEENIMTPVDDNSMTADGTSGGATCGVGHDPTEFNASMSPRTLARQLNLGNTYNLERRIKRELEEAGVLDCDESKSTDDQCNPDDEVLLELKRKMTELKSIGQHNVLMTQRMIQLAKIQISRQDLKKKLSIADAEVLESYRKIQIAKQKKKTPTKKEKDSIMRALKERTSIIKQLDSM
ncbi:transcriptional adapter 3-like [Tubulanus polymorphus]|uniref:transcriptional adapter 3-like n=1 Tax=Tubulanus polymorphus TaxID=672921 RepID=UPI003DA622CF